MRGLSSQRKEEANSDKGLGRSVPGRRGCKGPKMRRSTEWSRSKKSQGDQNMVCEVENGLKGEHRTGSS